MGYQGLLGDAESLFGGIMGVSGCVGGVRGVLGASRDSRYIGIRRV